MRFNKRHSLTFLPAATPNKPSRKLKCLDSNDRRAVFVYLLHHIGQDQKLTKELIAQTTTHFGIGRTQIQSIWRIGRQCDRSDTSALMKALSPKKKGRSGRRKITLPMEQIKALPPSKRRTIRCLAKHLGIPKSTIHDKIQQMQNGFSFISRQLHASLCPAKQLNPNLANQSAT